MRMNLDIHCLYIHLHTQIWIYLFIYLFIYFFFYLYLYIYIFFISLTFFFSPFILSIFTRLNIRRFPLCTKNYYPYIPGSCSFFLSFFLSFSLSLTLPLIPYLIFFFTIQLHSWKIVIKSERKKYSSLRYPWYVYP